jgi:hypothetical protein
MSEEQLLEPIVQINLDANFKDSQKGASDLDAALKQANEADFFITKAD